MKKNYLMWLIGGAALYFLTRKKETQEVAETTTPDLGNKSYSEETETGFESYSKEPEVVYNYSKEPGIAY